MDSLERNRRFALTIGFLSLIFLNYLRWNKIEPGHEWWPFGGDYFIYERIFSVICNCCLELGFSAGRLW